VTRAYLELSQESSDLARAEAAAASEALGGAPATDGPNFSGLWEVTLPDERAARSLAARLALMHRCLVLRAPSDDRNSWLQRAGANGGSARVRRLGSPSGTGDPAILDAGRRFVDGGGRIDLRQPDRRFWLGRDTDGEDWLLEELEGSSRSALEARRMPSLPFQRPVSLPPRLGRVAANLARIRMGDRVLDPFAGTGALLAEAGVLGARLYAIDRDDRMVRGMLANLAYLGLAAESVVAGDAGAVELPDEPSKFAAILTDPPYGRSSSTGGEPASELVARVLPRWARRVEPGGRVVVVVPSGAPPLDGIGRLVTALRLRVHRSLTREFRVYRVES
jgi:putative methyltransferase (TIGR01177 family)